MSSRSKSSRNKDSGCRARSSRIENRRRRSRSLSPPRNDSRRNRKDERPGPIKKEEVEIIEFVDPDIPDRTFGDLYCKACDSHMNSDMMWEAHIQGKRHLKHAKRGEIDLKYETPNEDPIILKELEEAHENEPIVGLQHCCEIQRLEGKPTYQCFLCSSNLPTSKALIDHLIGMKHRMAYIKEHDFNHYELINNTGMKKGLLEPILRDYALKYKDAKSDFSRMEVKREKFKPPVPYYPNKRQYKDDFDHRKRMDDRTNTYPEDQYDYGDSEWRQVKRNRSATPPDSYKKNPTNQETRKSPTRYQDREVRFDRDDSSKAGPRPLSPPPLFSQSANYNNHSSVSFPNERSSRSQPVEQEDLRQVIEQRRQDNNRTQSAPLVNKVNVVDQIVEVASTLPPVMFLKMVLSFVQKMDPGQMSESELSLFNTIGNHMISVVMDRKLKTLSPDLLNKYQHGSSMTIPEPTERSEIDKPLTDLMQWMNSFKAEQQSLSNTTEGNHSLSAQRHYDLQNSQNSPAFMTQMSGNNQWGQSSTSTYETSGIPGLTLAESNDTTPSSQFMFLQDPIGTRSSANTSWAPVDQYKDHHKHY